MKKYFTFYSIGWIVVLFEIILCAVLTLSVLLVNGTDAIGKDHVALFLLLAITIVSIVLMKSGKHFLNKAAVGLALLPLFFLSYQVLLMFMSTGTAPVPANHQAFISIIVI